MQAQDLLGHGPPFEQRGERMLLLAAPSEPYLYAMDGRVISSPVLRDAMNRRVAIARVERPIAAQLGLPARTAMAGFAYADAGDLGTWGVAVVESAARERDREKRAQWRLLLSVFVASALVLAFGGVAARQQRKELELGRELAVAEVERERDQRLARAERVAMTGTFAMGIVHEVSTPLGVIMGRAEQLLDRFGDDERAARSAKVIVQQTEHIQEIIHRFLDMARGGHLVFELADPSDVARAAVGAVQHRFVKASVSLTTDLPPDMPPIQCDRALLEHALVNLLRNACDACGPDGHVDLALRADGESAAFVVTDDGVGIRPEDAAHVTQPFFSTKPVGSGAGIGLSIASEIARSHRGELTIAPIGVRGTRACIEIPVAPPCVDHGRA
jgi:signal transduction histidine kinase